MAAQSSQVCVSFDPVRPCARALPPVAERWVCLPSVIAYVFAPGSDCRPVWQPTSDYGDVCCFGVFRWHLAPRAEALGVGLSCGVRTESVVCFVSWSFILYEHILRKPSHSLPHLAPAVSLRVLALQQELQKHRVHVVLVYGRVRFRTRFVYGRRPFCSSLGACFGFGFWSSVWGNFWSSLWG